MTVASATLDNPLGDEVDRALDLPSVLEPALIETLLSTIGRAWPRVERELQLGKRVVPVCPEVAEHALAVDVKDETFSPAALGDIQEKELSKGSVAGSQLGRKYGPASIDCVEIVKERLEAGLRGLEQMRHLSVRGQDPNIGEAKTVGASASAPAKIENFPPKDALKLRRVACPLPMIPLSLRVGARHLDDAVRRPKSSIDVATR